jgi:hypothetical protein
MSDALFWSRRGMVACDAHAPLPASDLWRLEGWQPVPDWRRRANGTALQCQVCHGRPYARGAYAPGAEILRSSSR